MNDATGQDTPGPSRPTAQRARAEGQHTALLVVGAIALFAAGIAIGRASTSSTTPTPSSTASPCADVTRSFSDFIDSAKAARQGSDEARQNARMAMQVVVQNPTCFSPKDRAAAQELLNMR